MSDDLDAVQAQDHLQMVDRILSRVDEPASLSGSPFIIWGVVGAAMNAVVQLVIIQHGDPSLFWISTVLLVMALTFMVYFSLQLRKKERRGLLDRHVGNVFMIAWIVALFTMIAGSHIFVEWAQAAIWSVMFGAAMMNAASLARSRIVFIGGCMLILSIAGANLWLRDAGYILAAGDLIGMCGAGIALSLARGND